MSDSSVLPKSCPKCGAVVASDATEGLCPKCLMAEAMEPTLISDASKPRRSAILSAEELAPYFPAYEILRMLGRGGMGAVYLARQISLNRLVAIKLLPADMSEGEVNFAERFKNEAQAMAQLNHPGIVAVYDFGQTANGLLYIVMEYIEGTDVQLMLTSQGRLHSGHAMAITAHVCDALQYAHTRGIIHRDIKPSNIMVSNDGVVKVADFGLAKMSHGQTTGLTQSGMAMGTLHFMAPEALTLGSAVDQRADIYAVGVMLYQMLTGRLPQGMFEMPSFQVPGLDPRYDRIVARALRDDRELRYQQATELRYDLDAILTQPVEKVAPEAEAAVAVLPPVEERGKKGPTKLPRISNEAAAPLPPQKKSVGLIFAVLGLAAALVTAFVYFRDQGSVGPGPTTTQPALATKEKPFVNSLGMKFVPVPGTQVLFCIHETRKQDYAAYAAANPGVNSLWSNPRATGTLPVSVGDDHPVTNVSWEHAKAFCAWLSRRDGVTYRLPTDREWSFAVGIGQDERVIDTTTPESLMNQIENVFPWGAQWPPPHGAGNFADMSLRDKLPSQQVIEGYDDGYPTTAPVMSFEPNQLGLYDMGGNVAEWCEDWYSLVNKDRVQRGSRWSSDNAYRLWSSNRNHQPQTHTYDSCGFRCVLEVPAAATATATPLATPTAATKDAPFVNMLGMKFVPVPGTKVLFSIWDTRVRDYAVYARVNRVDDSWTKQEKDGVPVSREPEYPVAGVNWNDAQAFCQWLTVKEGTEGKLPNGAKYRLPTDEEWSRAVGLPAEQGASLAEKSGRNGVDFPWGMDFPPRQKAGNYGDEAFHERFPNAAEKWLQGYTDGFVTTSPVGSFPANAHGLYDMGGNVWQWCDDWFDATQKDRVVRGTAWHLSNRGTMLSSERHHSPPVSRNVHHGFRCVLELAPAITASTATSAVAPSATATKDAPFINNLGMKFVPVPITGGPTDKQRVLFSVWETRVQDYEMFATETKRDWPKPPFEQGATHPAVMVSWEDAKAFCGWLTERERKAGKLGVNEMYRLPSDHEWSCAAGLGDREDPTQMPSEKSDKIPEVFPWGRAWPPPLRTGNYHGEETIDRKGRMPLAGYRDEFTATSPAGSFGADAFGLFDLSGNVFEWCEDWLNDSHRMRVLRGGAWLSSSRNNMISSHRGYGETTRLAESYGFRVVLAVPAP